MAGLQSRRRDSFLYLFIGLLVLTFVGPIVATVLESVGIFVIDVSLSLTLAIALWSLRSTRWVFFGGIALIAVNLLATGVSLALGIKGASTVSDLSGLAFLVLCVVVATRQVFRLDRVDLNKVTGAFCIYVLMAVIWAVLFQLLERFSPGSFSGLEQYAGHALTWRLLYFSFVTLTTLGYGDVLPLTVLAESLTCAEAVLGQFYLSVLVAALIGAYLSDRQRHEETETEAQPSDQPTAGGGG